MYTYLGKIKNQSINSMIEPNGNEFARITTTTK